MFFLMLILYISAHLARQLMDGLPGTGVRAALYAVTFVEVLVAGFMAHMMSVLILFVAKPEKAGRSLVIALTVLLCAHAAVLLVGWPLDLIYYFDASNVYHRASGYLLSNLCPLFMLAIDIYLLIRYRKNYERRVKTAFWFYVIAPIVAIVIQSLLYGIQFIIFAMVIAAIYMFSVIIQKQNKEFEAQQMERSRIETELNMASSIQTHMLPNIFPAFPERNEFEIYATMEPAKEVGGDFYDFFMIDEDRLCMVVADVSGKGVPAALFSMIAKTLLKMQAETWNNPEYVLQKTNALLSENNKESMFVTVWLGVLEISTGELTYADAGHEKLLLYQNGEWKFLPKKGGPALAMLDPEDLEMLGDKSLFHNQTVQLRPGDAIFQYTDGVTEATDTKNELFGDERLLNAMNSAPTAKLEELLPHVRNKINEFVMDAEQFDDITMLGIRYKG